VRRARNPAKPRPAKPSIIIAHVEGSGIAEPVMSHAISTPVALKVPIKFWYEVPSPPVPVAQPHCGGRLRSGTTDSQ
jgi:hypothetical protein